MAHVHRLLPYSFRRVTVAFVYVPEVVLDALVHNFHDSFRSSCQPWLYPKPTVSRLVGSVRARTWRRLFWLVIARLWPRHFLELITQIANLSLEDVNLFFKFVIQLFPTQS